MQSLLDRQMFLVESLMTQSLLEWSKNEPIPELHNDKLFVVLLGAPGSGKSYFTKHFLQKYNDFKVFDPDTINQKRNLYGVNKEHQKLSNEDQHKHIKGNTDLVAKYLKQSLISKDSKSAFIYDTTGSNIRNIEEVTTIAKEVGYEVVIILIHRDLETSKAATISRAKTTGRSVDTDYLEKVYDTLSKNWKNFSKLGVSYYLVDIADNKYHFWKMTNDEFQKKEKEGWIKTDEPNLYYQETLLESRSIHLTKNNFLKEIKTNCSDYISLIDKPVFYRGTYNKNNFISIDPKNFTRDSLGQATYNYFGELFDIVTFEKEWPSRYHSVIMSNDKITAYNFGDVYVVIPVNNSKIVISPSSDFWLSFKDILSDVGGFNESVKLTLEDLKIKVKDHIEQLDLIGSKCLERSNSSYININLFDGFDGSVPFSEFLIGKIENSITNNDWKVVNVKDLQKESKTKEYWTDGKCYMIKSEYLMNNPEILTFLGIKKDLI